LLSYDVYFVTDQSPEPGAPPKPTPLTRQRFMSYIAPFDSSCRTVVPAKPVASLTPEK
jgi:hypothetical protein